MNPIQYTLYWLRGWLEDSRAGNLFYNIFIGWKQCNIAHCPDSPNVGYYCQRMKGHFGKHRDNCGDTWK